MIYEWYVHIQGLDRRYVQYIPPSHGIACCGGGNASVSEIRQSRVEEKKLRVCKLCGRRTDEQSPIKGGGLMSENWNKYSAPGGVTGGVPQGTI